MFLNIKCELNVFLKRRRNLEVEIEVMITFTLSSLEIIMFIMKREDEPTRNPIAITGDLGDEVDRLRTTNGSRSGTPREQPTRNPIAITGDLGDEVDRLRTTNGSRSGTPRERKSCLYLLKGKKC
uniref:Uncharacterized protein n=1 Tax=Schistosoma haematobium TaxID=6185 RepID=A0A094ZEG3_SCHHA